MSRSSEWTTSMSSAEAPSWLKERVYEPKRRRTVNLVRQAVDVLVKGHQRVSLAAVPCSSKEIDPECRGVSESAILNNHEAKAYYNRYKSWKGTPSRKSSGSGSQPEAPVQRQIDQNRDTSRVRQRLMRKSKDELANRVLTLEQGSAVQEEQWLRLNDNLLRWRLRAEKAEIQVENMRRALDAKGAGLGASEAAGQPLHTGAGVTDWELGSALEEALKRAKTAEEQSKDLRLRLFVKKVVRMRDKVRRLANKHAAKEAGLRNRQRRSRRTAGPP